MTWYAGKFSEPSVVQASSVRLLGLSRLVVTVQLECLVKSERFNRVSESSSVHINVWASIIRTFQLSEHTLVEMSSDISEGLLVVLIILFALKIAYSLFSNVYKTCHDMLILDNYCWQ